MARWRLKQKRWTKSPFENNGNASKLLQHQINSAAKESRGMAGAQLPGKGINGARSFSVSFSKKSQTKFGLIAASFTDWYRFFCCPSTSSICQLINKFWLKFMNLLQFIAIFGESNSINSSEFGELGQDYAQLNCNWIVIEVERFS